MQAIVFTGGQGPQASVGLAQLPPWDLILCADSGLDLALEWGIEPDMIVGDMDSTHSDYSALRFPNAKLRTFPRDKDFSDTELAILWAKEAGAHSVCLVGGGGGRLDHLLAIYALFSRDNAPDIWLYNGGVAHLIRGPRDFYLGKGRCISFFALGTTVFTAHSQGLRWPLDGLELGTAGFSLSNESLEDRVSIHPIKGSALMIINDGPGHESLGDTNTSLGPVLPLA